MREMKDSGIEWIGNIPKNWSILKLKYVLKFSGSGTTPPSNKLEFYDGDIEWIQSGDLYHTNTIVNTKVKLKSLALKYCPALKFYKAPFIVLAMYGASVGNASISCINACTNQACCVLYPNNENNLKFLYYWIVITKNELLKKSIGGGQPNINQITIRNLNFINLPYKNQQAIAEFLDVKCADIDFLTADIQKQIDILKEYKKSVITQAVTKGLDPNVEMKNTASQYWNKIPKKWYLSDIKYIFKIVKRIAGKEGFDILSVTQKGLKIKDTSRNEGQIAENYKGYQFVYPGDFVMNHMDLLTGWVDLSKLFGVTSPDYRVFKLRDNVQNEAGYYKYVMQCCYSCRIFYSLGQGVSTLGRWRLQTSVFNNFLLPVPPTTEQKAIADFLDAKCADIDAAIAGKQKQLDVLKEYKKSLIYEYVTGKKEVPCRE